MKKSQTKEETYLLKLHEMALAQGDPTAEVDMYAVGRAVGYNDKSVEALVRPLLQANFLKKGADTALYFTPHGLRLIAHLQE